MKTLPRISTELFGAIVLLMLMANDRVETTRLAQWNPGTWVSGHSSAVAAEITLPGIPAIQAAPPEKRNRGAPGDQPQSGRRYEHYAFLTPTGREVIERIRKEESPSPVGSQDSGESIANCRSLPTTQIAS